MAYINGKEILFSAQVGESVGGPLVSDINGEYYTELTLPEGIANIHDRAFAHWARFTKITLPDTLTNIYDRAFQYCAGLESVTIPANVTHIGASAFGYCTALKSVTFTGTPSTIAATAFEGCTALKYIYVPWAAGEVSKPNGNAWGSGATVLYNRQL